jgi:hypothetical protein
MKIILQLFTTIAVLVTYTSPATPEDDFPKPLVTEDLILTRDNIEQLIEDTPLLVAFFYDRQDSRMEKATANIRKALSVLKKRGVEAVLGTFEAPLTPRVEKSYHVYKFPKLIVFLNGQRYPMSAPPYPK